MPSPRIVAASILRRSLAIAPRCASWRISCSFSAIARMRFPASGTTWLYRSNASGEGNGPENASKWVTAVMTLSCSSFGRADSSSMTFSVGTAGGVGLSGGASVTNPVLRKAEDGDSSTKVGPDAQRITQPCTVPVIEGGQFDVTRGAPDVRKCIESTRFGNRECRNGLPPTDTCRDNVRITGPMDVCWIMPEISRLTHCVRFRVIDRRPRLPRRDHGSPGPHPGFEHGSFLLVHFTIARSGGLPVWERFDRHR